MQEKARRANNIRFRCVSVTHEVAGSSPVVPARIFNNLLSLKSLHFPDFNTDFNIEGHPWSQKARLRVLLLAEMDGPFCALEGHPGRGSKLR